MSSSSAGLGWVVAGVFGLMLLARCGERSSDVEAQAAFSAPAAYAVPVAPDMATDYDLGPQQYDPQYEPAPREAYVSYTNCSAARAVGAAPVYSGDPGYASHLDRDGDGVGCEN